VAVPVVLLRHGQTEWTLSGQHTGRTDIPLLREGETQAEAAGDFIRGLGFTSFGLVLTSPLCRASDTCAVARFDAEVDPDLMEWDYGAYEGLTSAEIDQVRPGWSLWVDGVPDGERVADVGRRADRVIERARRCDGPVLCVAHGHLLRVLAARWVGLPPVAGRFFVLWPGALSVLSSEHDFPVIQLWNRLPDTASAG
jgi:probable phosphoglycerate mutase